ncbi:unnamed protein product [Arabis nemorensis]|uniref:DUF4283 domain-containing protein n=1 Tax=Arabis nemorensis TaxID=586526 RepID=A0A565AN35_9BRAS|nr:unnamed protein product [Arabis nemorensis]
MGTSSPEGSPSLINQVPFTSQESPANQLPKGPLTSLISGKVVPNSSYATEVEIINDMAKVNIPDEVRKLSQPLWTSYMVGHFIGEAPHIGKVHATVNKIWTSGSRVSKIDAQFLNPKTVMYRIEDSMMRQTVLQRHFWHIGEIPLVVQEWNPKATNLKPDLSAMPIWFLGDVIGISQKLHPNTLRCVRLDVARVLVVVNLENPLLNVISLNDEEETLVKVSYPWLPSRCLTCNTWGHNDVECGRMKKGAMVVPEQNGLGNSPRVSSPTKVLSSQDSLGALTDSASNRQRAEVKGQLVEREAQVEGQGLSDETEQEWTCVRKGGNKSPQKKIDEVGMRQIAAAKTINESETTSPSRFNVLAKISEEEEDKEDGEIGVEETAKEEENHLVSSEDEAPITQAIQKDGESRKKQKGQNKSISIKNLAPHKNAKKSSSRRN